MPIHNLAEDTLVLMVTVVNRGHGERIAADFTQEGVTFDLLFLGKGTASSTILNYLGLGETEKEMLFSTMPYATSRKLIRMLESKTNIRLPGHGIAFTVPIDSVCGLRADHCIRGACSLVAAETIKGEEAHKMEQLRHELIVAITNRGYTDDIMEEARSAGATGGTVFHARRLGHKEAEKFFGVTVQPEKEVLFILADSQKKSAIMQAITARAGLHTEAKTVVFSLPVLDVIGLTDTQADLPEKP